MVTDWEEDLERGVSGARRSAFRTPSRERKRIVDSRSSNWIEAVPKTAGVASRTRDWLRRNVTIRERNWRAIRDEAVARDLDSSVEEPSDCPVAVVVARLIR